jgi:CheY-like chemotaxis protein
MADGIDDRPRGEAAGTTHAPAPAAARRPRVLVVDDDALVGKSIGRLLQHEFEVVFTQSAAGALGRIGSARGFAAVVCDFRMPGMDGIKFHEELARLDPSLASRIVFLTGWTGEPAFEAFLQRTRCPCLPKPFQPEALRLAVATACDAAE